MHAKQPPISEALKALIREGTAGTQAALVAALRAKGYDVSQSKVSRLLRKLMALKIKDEHGQTIYTLPKEPMPPSSKSTLTHLILNVQANESLVIIQASPGSASLIARMLDYHEPTSTILGTIAGDDTIFVAPKSVRHIQKTLQEVQQLLAKLE